MSAESVKVKKFISNEVESSGENMLNGNNEGYIEENRMPGADNSEIFPDLGYDSNSEMSSIMESARLRPVTLEIQDDTRSVQSLPVPLEFISEGSSHTSFEHSYSVPPGQECGWTVAMQKYYEHLQQSASGLPPTCIDKEYLHEFVTSNMVNVRKFISALDKTGINIYKDIRFQTLIDALTTEKSVTDSGQIPVLRSIPLEDFEQFCRPNASLINQALSGQLILPDFGSFCQDVTRLFHQCRNLREGKASSNIKQHVRQIADMWSVSICTVDGQRMSVGNHTTPFSMQSLRDVLIYTLAITDCGEEEVHSRVGKEPAGDVNDSLVLDRDGLPHNAMIPAGALAVISLIKPNLTLPDRFDYLFGIYERLAGFEGIDFSNTNYLAEKMAADHIYSIAYHLKGHTQVFPQHCRLQQTIDLYLQLNSIECTTDSAATIAATLANGGVCPFTAEAVYSPEAVRNVLSLLHSCGVRKISGQIRLSLITYILSSNDVFLTRS
jgi:glutaminase